MKHHHVLPAYVKSLYHISHYLSHHTAQLAPAPVSCGWGENGLEPSCLQRGDRHRSREYQGETVIMHHLTMSSSSSVSLDA